MLLLLRVQGGVTFHFEVWNVEMKEIWELRAMESLYGLESLRGLGFREFGYKVLGFRDWGLGFRDL